MYKIFITKIGINDWVAILKKRYWLFGYHWRYVDGKSSTMPYTESVEKWQTQYDIPDSRVHIF